MTVVYYSKYTSLWIQLIKSSKWCQFEVDHSLLQWLLCSLYDDIWLLKTVSLRRQSIIVNSVTMKSINYWKETSLWHWSIIVSIVTMKSISQLFKITFSFSGNRPKTFTAESAGWSSRSLPSWRTISWVTKPKPKPESIPVPKTKPKSDFGVPEGRPINNRVGLTKVIKVALF